MRLNRAGGVPRWLFYFAVAASWVFGAEIVILTAARRTLPGRLPAAAGWLFVGAIAISILAITRLEMMSRERTSNLVEQLEEALDSITALTAASLTSLELPELLDRSLERLVTVVKTKVAIIFLLSESGTELEAVAARGIEGLETSTIRIYVADNDGLLSRVVVTELPVSTTSNVDLAVLSSRTGQKLVSAAACPILVEGRLIGICVTGSTSPKRFDVRELHLMQLVADRAGLGIERRRLDEGERRARIDVERGRRYAIVLATASAALATARDSYLPNLTSLVDSVVPTFCDWCAIDLFGRDGKFHRVAIRHLANRGEPCSEELRHRIPLLDAMLVRALSSGQTQESAGFVGLSASTVPRVNEATLVDPTPWIAVPFMSNRGPKGVVTFAFDGGVDAINPSMVPTAEDLVRRASIAIERVVLFQEAQSVAEHSTRVADQLEQLLGASMQVSHLTDGTQVASTISARALAICGADGAVVMLDGGDEAPLRVIAEHDGGIRTGSVELLPSDRDLPRALSDVTATGRIEGILATPIRDLTGTRVGVLAIWRSTGPDFSQEDETVLVLLAQTTSTALSSVELYRTIQTSETRWRTLIETAPIGAIEVDLGGNIRWANRSAQQIFSGSGIAIGLGAGDADQRLNFAQFEPLWARAATGAEVRERELIGVPIGAARRDLLVSVVPLFGVDGAIQGILMLVTDISDRRRLEGELQQAQRMEALGQLAGNVAHDFGNLLTLVSGYTELLRAEETLSERQGDLVNSIQSVVERAALLTGRLLTISRSQAPHPTVLDPADALRSMEEVLAKILGNAIELHYDFETEGGRVAIDPSYFDQIILNLAVNARDAMPTGGTFSVHLHKQHVGPTEAARRGIHGGDSIELVVSDTGTGMSAETAARCFEPFFTTKGPAKGTGLGLSAVRSVVLECGGTIEVRSHLGIGTSFVIHLPATSGPLAVMAAVSEALQRVDRAAITILVADDDDTLRSLVKKVLVQAGYEVLSAASGELALELAQGWSGHLDLLVTDVSMPGMDGPELARKITEISPETSVLFISTNTAGIKVDESGSSTIAFMSKPFRPSELLAQVNSIVNNEAPTSTTSPVGHNGEVFNEATT